MNIQEQYFTCKKCGESKIWADFCKCKKSKIKIRYKCKACKNQEQKNGIEAKGKENQRKYNREWYAKNRSRHKVYQKQYWAKSGISVTEYRRRYLAENRDRIYSNRRSWSKLNLDKRAEINKRYIAKHPEKHNEFRQRKIMKEKIDRVENPEKYRRYRANIRENLTAGYVRYRLIKNGFTREQIAQTPELINIQRIIIQTKRLCKT